MLVQVLDDVICTSALKKEKNIIQIRQMQKKTRWPRVLLDTYLFANVKNRGKSLYAPGCVNN